MIIKLVINIMSQKRRIYCRFCDAFFYSMDDLVSHLETTHEDMIPKDMSAYQFAYFIKTNKDHGNCVVCKGKTTWNEKTKKYNRFCNNPKCKDEYKKIFNQRMIGKYGKVNLLNDPDHQRKMLANRKISGLYLWSDHVHKFPYTGTYELSFLKFLDLVMQFDPEDIMMPSPHTYSYTYGDKQHFYIPDVFIPSLDLEIEIKDHSTTHPKIVSVDRVKEQEKDKVMKSNLSTYNYLKIVDKNNMKFVEFLNKAKENFDNNDRSHIFMI